MAEEKEDDRPVEAVSGSDPRACGGVGWVSGWGGRWGSGVERAALSGVNMPSERQWGGVSWSRDVERGVGTLNVRLVLINKE